MKKTIALMALLVASTNAMALRAESDVKSQPPKTMCFKINKLKDKSITAADCDDSDKNIAEKRKLSKNGCATGQVAIMINQEINVPKCLPAGVVQL